MSNEKNVAEQEETVDTVENVESDAEIVDADDVQVEETEVVDESAAKISELQAKLDETENKMLRAQADFDNFRRRARLDQEAAQKYRAQSLVSEILPALDNFERALQIEASNDQTKSLLQGMNMVYNQLVQALQNEGVETIKSVGEQFDPHLHQAVMQVEDENYDSNTVIEELQKGYRLKDRVIRPAMVKVNQ
ncbi:nucleotide exchange factor GrpE [Metabacillus litoralis]|uniref:nucleotide exchange factor GrpE n=1 Tax=Metabacillus TaxID=2675233 RepID=UPI000EF5E0BE|nr:nucleotide exchange factor GrpE [Metabacillus litoralis]MCM3161843.1 nucleotide exchange factor GrpE [Metabacillus litoralis]MCM3413024.1 nucleotide exchange factor GrpE [Metabacillus litoralis]UHA62427.1 nucleotide exchange factor GrpE [Metabacillus litoralis]